ncbi:MAG: hypothetical protein AAF490_09390 [Chloroflexota bacterium]
MAIEEKVHQLESDIHELGQRIQQILKRLERENQKAMDQIQPPQEVDDLQMDDVWRFEAETEIPTRPLTPPNQAIKQEDIQLAAELEHAKLVVETMLDDDDEFIDDLIDFFPAHASNGKGGQNTSHSQFDEQITDEAEPDSETFDPWQSFEIDQWIDESYAQNDSCYQQFRFLLEWVEETVGYIGQQKMLRTLNLYNRHGYIPDNVYVLLRDVIQLMPKNNSIDGDTHQIINALMELNGMLEGDIHIGMTELMEIVGNQ